jgi:hypothetical protein
MLKKEEPNYAQSLSYETSDRDNDVVSVGKVWCLRRKGEERRSIRPTECYQKLANREKILDSKGKYLRQKKLSIN